MRCLVTGVSGYVGGRLVPLLLAEGHQVRCLVRSALRLRDVPWAGQVEIVEGDVTDRRGLAGAIDDVDVVYYLVHALGRADFEDVDRTAAGNVADAARDAGVGRIVYPGGPAPTGPGAGASAHLRSRTDVADIFLGSGVPTVVLRAAVIIGSGSASFEMLRYLTERLPVMVTPRWVRTRVQPIAIGDVLRYLVACADPARFPAGLSRGRRGAGTQRARAASRGRRPHCAGDRCFGGYRRGDRTPARRGRRYRAAGRARGSAWHRSGTRSWRRAARRTYTLPTCAHLRRSRELLHRYRRIDVVVSNAGRSIRRSVADIADRFHDVERTLGVNYLGPVQLLLVLLPAMRRPAAGASSTFPLRGWPHPRRTGRHTWHPRRRSTPGCAAPPPSCAVTGSR